MHLQSGVGWIFCDQILSRDLALSYLKIGVELSAQNKLDSALEAYQKSLEERELLAAKDTGNAYWQRELAASEAAIAGVMKWKGWLDEALANYQDSMSILKSIVDWRWTNGEPR